MEAFSIMSGRTIDLGDGASIVMQSESNSDQIAVLDATTGEELLNMPRLAIRRLACELLNFTRQDDAASRLTLFASRSPMRCKLELPDAGTLRLMLKSWSWVSDTSLEWYQEVLGDDNGRAVWEQRYGG